MMQTMGPYLCVQQLATSEYAELFAAQSAVLSGKKQMVLLRRMLPGSTMRKDFGDGFVSYNHVLYGLSHPNVCVMVDFGIHTGHWFQAFQHPTGQNLAAWRTSETALKAVDKNTGVLAYVLQETVQGLVFLKQHGLLQEVVSPESVFVTEEGRVYILPPLPSASASGTDVFKASLDGVLDVLGGPHGWVAQIKESYLPDASDSEHLLHALDLASATWGLDIAPAAQEGFSHSKEPDTSSLLQSCAIPPQSNTASCIRTFVKHPTLHNLALAGTTAFEESHVSFGVSALKNASLRYAQRGLFTQALFCARKMQTRIEESLFKSHVLGLTDHTGLSDDILKALPYLNQSPEDQALQAFVHPLLSPTVLFDLESPFLSYLDKEGLYQIALQAPLEKFKANDVLITRGTHFTSMYLVASGWVLVKVPYQEKTLTVGCFGAGECVGENGYFADEARSADVCALGETQVFVLSRSLINAVTQNLPLARRALLQFYKKRIAHSSLSQSPIFGWFTPEERSLIVQASQIRAFSMGEMLVKEGIVSKNMYLIKSGSAEVYTGSGSQQHLLARVHAGDFVGEISALKNMHATAHVEANGPVEALEIPGHLLQQLLQKNPLVQEKIQEEIARRTRENLNHMFGRQ